MNFGYEGIKRTRYMYSFFRKRMVHLNLQILYTCNFRCKICDFWRAPYKDMPHISLDQVRLIAGKLKALGPLLPGYQTPWHIFASGGQGALLKNRPLDPHKTFY